MVNIKHVGRLIKSKRRVVVAYRVVPGEPENCVVITTETLSADEHDALMNVVESHAAQSASELAPVLSRSVLPDGRNMLAAFHTTGKMMKQATSEVEMLPNNTTSVPLNELNELIAQQMGVTVADLAMADNATTQPSTAETAPEEVVETAQPASTDGVLTDEDLAKQYRSQADAMFKEAKRLREQAEELAPTKKKAKSEQAE